MTGGLALGPAMIASYGAGTLLLQMGFQRAGALVTAGLATLLTNAIPILAGMTIFHEPLPSGLSGALRRGHRQRRAADPARRPRVGSMITLLLG